jgi:ribose transport system permease protein
MRNLRWQIASQRRPYLFALVLLIVTLFINFIYQPNLFERTTLNSNLRVFLPLILIAAGQAIVILGGGIDISVGAIVSIVNAILATQLGVNADPQKTILFLLLVLLAGMAAGAINGFFTAVLRLQPIITTYATSFLYAGIALFILPTPGGGIPNAFSAFYRETTPLGIPLSFYIILVVLLMWYFMRQTRFGHYLFAVGGKPDAAYATAVPVSTVQFLTYVISGLMAAFSGIAVTMLTGSGNAQIGDSLTLTSITAVVIGGTVLSGGVGGVPGAVIGAIILGLIPNIISFSNVDLWWQTFVNAGLIVLGLAAPGMINLFQRKKRR